MFVIPLLNDDEAGDGGGQDRQADKGEGHVKRPGVILQIHTSHWEALNQSYKYFGELTLDFTIIFNKLKEF